MLGNDNPLIEYGNDVEGTAFCSADADDPLGSSGWNLEARLCSAAAQTACCALHPAKLAARQLLSNWLPRCSEVLRTRLLLLFCTKFHVQSAFIMPSVVTVYVGSTHFDNRLLLSCTPMNLPRKLNSLSHSWFITRGMVCTFSDASADIINSTHSSLRC